MPNNTRRIMGAGMAAAAARAISGGVSDNLIAAGNSQATALPLYGDTNVVTTAPASSGVLLPTNMHSGDEVQVANLGANSLSVYPPVGGAINTGAANAAFAVGAGKVAVFTARTGGLNWIANLSA